MTIVQKPPKDEEMFVPLPVQDANHAAPCGGIIEA